MNEDNLEGAVKNGAGKVESLAGETIGDPGLKAQGQARQFEGKMQDALGAVHGTIDKVAGQAKAAASNVNAQASDVYTKVSQTASEVAATVSPFVEEKPYAALALAAVGGLLAGLLISARGPRVIYVRSKT